MAMQDVSSDLWMHRFEVLVGMGTRSFIILFQKCTMSLMGMYTQPLEQICSKLPQVQIIGQHQLVAPQLSPTIGYISTVSLFFISPFLSLAHYLSSHLAKWRDNHFG
ncbi:hypothetical protein VNO77_03283 [Canavalia gladiata]|uniref:Uncharacterized protein n=1 Tax=Canavalia gladiata TaxID=3824 RepID=A0AAN9R3Q4_CANGL